MTHRCRLYLITPPVIDDAKAFATLLEQALDAGDVAAIQVRLKDVSEAHLAEVTKAVLAVGQDYEVAVLLNDSPELAAKFGCDGVHIGQSDGTLKDARKITVDGSDAFVQGPADVLLLAISRTSSCLRGRGVAQSLAR